MPTPALQPRTRDDQLDPPSREHIAAIVQSRGGTVAEATAKTAWLLRELGHKPLNPIMRKAAARWERMRKGGR